MTRSGISTDQRPMRSSGILFKARTRTERRQRAALPNSWSTEQCLAQLGSRTRPLPPLRLLEGLQTPCRLTFNPRVGSMSPATDTLKLHQTTHHPRMPVVHFSRHQEPLLTDYTATEYLCRPRHQPSTGPHRRPNPGIHQDILTPASKPCKKKHCDRTRSQP